MMNRKIKLCLFVATYNRLELTDYVFSYYSGLKKRLNNICELTLICVGSNGQLSENIATKNGFVYFEYPNEPLSYKYNFACEKCKNFNPDGVLVIGSDDIISYELFEYYVNSLKLGFDFCGATDMYMLVKDKLIYWGGYEETSKRFGETIGAGRLFSRNLIEQLNWHPWQGKPLNRGLDGLCTLNLSNLNYKVNIISCKDVNGYILDIKTNENLTNPDRFKNKQYYDIGLLIDWGLDITDIDYLLYEEQISKKKSLEDTSNGNSAVAPVENFKKPIRKKFRRHIKW